MQGILFLESLYKKIVEGNKTMTRRSGANLHVINDYPDFYELVGFTDDTHNAVFWRVKDPIPRTIRPRYKLGEILYIKEPIHKLPDGTTIYKYCNHLAPVDIKWSNKLFMPKSDAREFIKITGVTVQRLLDITPQDCIKEGIPEIRAFNPELTKNAFFNLYAEANGIKKKPLKNIWLFVYEFEHLKNYKHEM